MPAGRSSLRNLCKQFENISNAYDGRLVSRLICKDAQEALILAPGFSKEVASDAGKVDTGIQYYRLVDPQLDFGCFHSSNLIDDSRLPPEIAGRSFYRALELGQAI